MERRLISDHKGFFPKTGKGAKIERNSYKIYEDSLGKYVEMSDSKGNVFTFDIEDLNLIINMETDKGNRCSWYVAKVGSKTNNDDLYYVCCRNGQKTLYIHTEILNNPPVGMTVDHKNNDTLNNRRHNLHYATQARQNHNRGKVGRKTNARDLPEGVTQEDIPKYVNYNKDTLQSGSTRDFWRIEKHPVQVLKLYPKKQWSSSKSNKITPMKKLEQTKEKLKEFDKLLENPANMKKWNEYLDKTI